MKDIKFVYDKPAAIIHANGRDRLVIGDLHIGAEKRLIDKGVKLYNATGIMAKEIVSIASEFDIHDIIMLGDIKDSIMHPERVELMNIKGFFNALEGYKVKIVRGNHDAYISEITGIEPVDELLIGRFALLHGNRWPTEPAMRKSYIMTAHNHISVSFKDKRGGYYQYKAWMIAKLNPEEAAKRYGRFNRGVKLIMMPAFNELIMGMPISKHDSDNINPLVRNKIFDYADGTVYNLAGENLGRLSKISEYI